MSVGAHVCRIRMNRLSSLSEAESGPDDFDTSEPDLVFKSRRPTTPHAGLAAWYRF